MSQMQGDSLHLMNALIACEGPLTHKLKQFFEYIVRHAHPSVAQTHANGLLFWWEVQKFKVNTRIQILCITFEQ